MKTISLRSHILLGCTLMLASATAQAQTKTPPLPQSKTFNLADSTRVINAVKNEPAKIPTFTKLAPKPRYVRGFVKDSNGKPVVGARIGVTSTAVGGFNSSAQGKTDAKGYYEIMVPFGVARFYNAGKTVNYGDGVAPLGLHPSDGQLDDFASPQGAVKNWVLLPYGIADRADLQTSPQDPNNYYGGQIVITLRGPNTPYGEQYAMPAGAEVEIKMTPLNRLVDGNLGRAFVFRKEITEDTDQAVYISNIPLARYRLTGRLVKSGQMLALNFKETGSDLHKGFGLSEGDIENSYELMLRPYNGRAESVTARHGHWAPVQFDVVH